MRYQCERYFGDEGDNASDELGDILAKISGEMCSAATASFGMTVSAAAHSRLQQQAEHLKLTSAAILSNKFLLASRILSFAFDDNVLFYIAVQLLNECSPQSLELLGLKPAVQDVIPTYSKVLRASYPYVMNRLGILSYLVRHNIEGALAKEEADESVVDFIGNDIAHTVSFPHNQSLVSSHKFNKLRAQLMPDCLVTAAEPLMSKEWNQEKQQLATLNKRLEDCIVPKIPADCRDGPSDCGV